MPDHPPPPLTPAERRDHVAAMLDAELVAPPFRSTLAVADLAAALERLTRLADLDIHTGTLPTVEVAEVDLERYANLDEAAYRVVSILAAGGPVTLEDMQGTRFEDLVGPLADLARHVAERPA